MPNLQSKLTAGTILQQIQAGEQAMSFKQLTKKRLYFKFRQTEQLFENGVR